MSYSIDEFALDLRKSTAPANHIWVGSGNSTCAPLADTVMGVCGCYSPPIAAPDIKLMISLRLNGHTAEDTGNRGKNDCGLLFSGAQWRPDMITRTGTYHYSTDTGLLSAGVISRLVPMRGIAGFVLEAEVENRTSAPMTVEAVPELSPGAPGTEPLGVWEFMPPHPETKNAEPAGDDTWANDDLKITLIKEPPEKSCVNPGETAVFRFGVLITEHDKETNIDVCLKSEMNKTLEHWQRLIERVNSSVPELRSSIPELDAYYRRSLVSGLVCLWDNPAFAVNPFPATSGIDGGSLCCYPWDAAGYSAEALIMLTGEKAAELLRALLRSGIDKHISMSLDGGGLGWCSYSYSMWSIMNLYRRLLAMLGKGGEMFDEIKELFLQEEKRLPEQDHLKDYGRQHNLLEMRTCGYEYFVPSPNAERAWCYDCLADIAEQLGTADDTQQWRRKAQSIRKSIQQHLWDNEKKWFVCRHPEGHNELVYSIQCYDALRMGACTSEMKAGLTAHLRDGAFLGRFGVSSVSAEDTVHYELNDPDWSGGGSYTGEGPNLAEMLWQNGEAELAWEVLSRHFWMGEMLPYFPQEHYCDKPCVPANKRANIIAGTAGMQAILDGMAGFSPELDGSLKITPNVPRTGYADITGYRHRGINVSLHMEPNLIRVTADGKILYEGEPKEIIIPAR